MATKKIQILGSLGDKIYKQNDEPVDAPDGSLWIDLDENIISGSFALIDTTLTQSRQAADAKVVGDALRSYIDDIDTLIGGDV